MEINRWTILGMVGGLLNLFDAFATHFLICSGVAYETNPAMAWLQAIDWNLFIFLKMCVVGLFVWLGVQCKNSWSIKIILILLVFTYISVDINHILIYVISKH